MGNRPPTTKSNMVHLEKAGGRAVPGRLYLSETVNGEQGNQRFGCPRGWMKNMGPASYEALYMRTELFWDVGAIFTGDSLFLAWVSLAFPFNKQKKTI